MGDAMTNSVNEDDPDDRLPDILRSALNDRYGAVPDVPEAVDRAILADARRHLATRVAPKRWSRWTSWKVAALASTIAAACLVLAVRSPWTQSDSLRSEVAQKAFGRDLDGNGRVDILDAFAMARDIRNGRTLSMYDVNGDGRQDQSDVDELAKQAVML